jgi:hypothetical protein
MFNIYLTLNILPLSLIVVAAGLTGFLSRGHQIRKKQMKIVELRREMVKNHAQILELQKEYVALEHQMQVGKTPVLPIKSVVIDFKDEDKKVADGKI